MLKKKLISISIIVFSFICIFIFCKAIIPKPFLQADYMYFTEIEDIIKASDVIVIGNVIKAKEVKHLMVDVTPNKAKEDKETTPYTLSTVQITEVIKGNVKVGDVITIKQLGDYIREPESTLYELDGYLKENNKELMFLCEYDDCPYSPINPGQGLIEVRADGTLYSASTDSFFGYRGDDTEAHTVEKTDTLQLALERIRACIN